MHVLTQDFVVDGPFDGPIGEISKLFGISITGAQKWIEANLLRPAARRKLAARPGLEASLDSWRGNFHS